MKTDDLDRVDARLQAMITVIAHDAGAPRSSPHLLRELQALRWAARRVRSRMVRRISAPLPALNWRARPNWQPQTA